MVDHATMNETSLMMVFRLELVQMKNLPDDNTKWPVGIMREDPRIYAKPEVGLKSISEQKEQMVGILKKALSEL